MPIQTLVRRLLSGRKNGLLNSLIAYWPGNEVSGNALDLHTNVLHLTDVNTVTSNSGLVYPLARQYTAVNNEYHARPGDDALLSVGDVDFTLAQWVRFDTVNVTMGLGGKWNVGNPTREYAIFYAAPNYFQFAVSTDGTTPFTVNAATHGVVLAWVWHLVVSWHDSVANTINIQVDNGAVDSTSHTLGVFDGTSRFAVGLVSTSYMNGRIGPTMFWKSEPGGGGVLNAVQRAALYNGGAGLPYAKFTT